MKKISYAHVKFLHVSSRLCCFLFTCNCIFYEFHIYLLSLARARIEKCYLDESCLALFICINFMNANSIYNVHITTLEVKWNTIKLISAGRLFIEGEINVVVWRRWNISWGNFLLISKYIKWENDLMGWRNKIDSWDEHQV